MRTFNNSKTLITSLLVSVLVHVCLFVLLFSPIIKKKAVTPIEFDFLNMPAKSNKAAQTPSLKKGGGDETKSKAVKQKTVAIPSPEPPVKTAKAPDTRTQSQTKTPDAVAPRTPELSKAPSEAHPIEVPKAAPLPGNKDLSGSQDKFANIGKGMGEGSGDGGSEEETVSLDGTEDRFSAYVRGLKFKIEEAWKYPDAARKSALQGGGLVGFTIQKDGTLTDLKIMSSSGYPILDEAILKAVKDAAPFDPLTKNIRTKKLNVKFSFEYTFAAQRIGGRR